MKNYVFFSFVLMLILIASMLTSQNITITDDGTYTAHNSAMLDVKSLTKGLLIPRMTETERDAITSPATGLLVFVTDDNNFYYYDGSSWKQFSGGSDGDWTVSGNDMYSAVSGNVGIGSSAPLEKLEVNGNIRFRQGADRSLFVGESSTGIAHNGFDLTVNAGNAGGYIWGPGPYPGGELFLRGGNAGGILNAGKGGNVNIVAGDAAGIQGVANGGDVYVYGGLPVTNGDPGNVILAHNGFDPFGRVGVGTSIPVAELDVNGKTKTLQLQVGTTSTPGDILTAVDSYGNAAWQPAGGGGGGSWNLTGNAGTVPGTDFLGTTDNTALQLHVNSIRALRIEPHSTSPNLIGGYFGNIVNSGVFGATISGGGTSGNVNQAIDNYCVISGGYKNVAGDPVSDSYAATVGGGSDNIAGHRYTTVSGGYSNTADRQFATIGGGMYNTASHQYSTVCGGTNNFNRGDGGAIGGGQGNTIGLYGHSAVIPGGWKNSAYGMFSLAAGNKAKADHHGSIVIAANSATWVSPADSINSGGDEQMVLRADGGMYITNTGGIAPYDPSKLINTSTGAYLSDAGIWTNSFKTDNLGNIKTIDKEDILEKVAQLSITQWSLEGDNSGVSHIGPSAREMNNIFGLASESESISTIDPAGIALAAIQGLYKRLQEKETQIETLEQRLKELENKIAALKK